MTYSEEMAALFTEATSAEWFGTVVTFNDIPIICIADPITSGFDPTVNAYNAVATTVFDILRTDAISSGLYASVIQDNPHTKRPIVTSTTGQEFECLRFENDDVTQPSIRLIASRLQ